jgi:formamidopyrimidine-DNA glycosylase
LTLQSKVKGQWSKVLTLPELPEVQTIVNELNRKLKNKTISSVTVNAPKMVHLGPAVVSNRRQVSSYKVINFIKLLQNQKITAVKRRAKLLIFDFSGPLSLLVHLKMTGQFIYEDKAQKKKTSGKYRIINKLNAPLVQLPSKHTHVIFTFNDSSTLYFNDVRKFGYLKVVKDSEIDQVKELKTYGPEPLSKEFTYTLFFTAVKKRVLGKIKLVLMDPKVVAGIGNIYSDEILFHAKVRPTRQVASIKNQELRNIYKWIKPVLEKGIKAKGSSVGDFVRTNGSWGQMGKFHFVYGRKGQKCKKCGTIIESVKLNGRTGSFCPNCQK